MHLQQEFDKKTGELKSETMIFPRYTNVSVQDRGYYLFDVPCRFRLRPDIVARGEEGNEDRIVVMDTKWKKLNLDSRSNYGMRAFQA